MFPIHEAFVASIILVGIGVMIRAVRLPAAFMLIGIILLVLVLLPLAGSHMGGVSAAVVFTVIGIIAINILRGIFSVLFGQSAADGFTGKLLFGIFTPILNMISRILRAIFRMR